MVNVSEERLGQVIYTNITLTRGDDCTLVMPIYTVAADGTRTEYLPGVSDTFAIHVREAPVTGIGTTTSIAATSYLALTAASSQSAKSRLIQIPSADLYFRRSSRASFSKRTALAA